MSLSMAVCVAVQTDLGTLANKPAQAMEAPLLPPDKAWHASEILVRPRSAELPFPRPQEQQINAGCVADFCKLLTFQLGELTCFLKERALRVTVLTFFLIFRLSGGKKKRPTHTPSFFCFSDRDCSVIDSSYVRPSSGTTSQNGMLHSYCCS